MFHYLAPYVGSGTDDDPFRPRGSEQLGWAAIDLRPDCTILSGRALLAVPVRDDTIGAYLGDAPDEVSAAVRAAIASRFGITLAANRLRHIIPELLIAHAREDGTRWRPLRAMHDGVFRVYLGGLWWQAKSLSGGSTITENFNTANSDTLGPERTWTELVGDIDIVSNQARNGALEAPASVARADVDLESANHYVQVVCDVSEETNAGTPGVICRKDSSTTMTFYLTDAVFNNDTMRIYKCVAGTFTALATAAAQTLTPGTPGTIKLQANGSTITVWWNTTVKHNLTDTAISGNVRCGIRTQKNTTGYTTQDSFEARDLSSIAFVNQGSGTTPAITHDTTVTVTIPATAAGNDLIVVCASGDDPDAPGVVSTVAATGATFSLVTAITNTHTRVEIWSARNVSASITSVVVTYASATVASVCVGEYSGVQSIGANGTTSGSGANPAISLTTQDANNFVVAGFCQEGTAQSELTLALSSSMRSHNYAAGDGVPDVSGALVDNGAVTAGSVTNSVVAAALNWAAATVELRTSTFLSYNPWLHRGPVLAQ